MSIEAMKQALEALELWLNCNLDEDTAWQAHTSLRKAIAEAEKQEPVAEFKSPHKRWEDGDDHDPRSEAIYKFIADVDFKHNGDSFCFKSGGDGDNGETLMFLLDCWFAAHPQPKRTWVWLTDEEIGYYIVHSLGTATKKNLIGLIRLCESKLKEKNT